jgi:putative dehydrogenase
MPHSDAITVAIVGTGEMGTAIGRRLQEYGSYARTSLAGRRAASARRVERAGIEVRNDNRELIAGADFLLSIVPPSQAFAVAEQFVKPLTEADAKPVFVECNAVSPATLNRIAEVLETTGCRFIDAGIIGGPPPARRDPAARRTVIYASGKDAALLTQLSAHGIDIELLDERIGSASALKMCYAGITKGLTALGSVMIRAAARNGLASALYSELFQSQPEILKLLSRRIPDMLPKAYRWIGEMQEIARFLRDDPAGVNIFNGAEQVYKLIADQIEQTDGVKSAELALLLKFFETATSKA